MKSLKLTALVSALLLLVSSSAFSQGNLTPPAGSPAPTMKSLEQIASTGIALNDTNTPGDIIWHHIINTPGSYFLTGNLDVTKSNGGIQVNAANVTIDLNGFRIIRTAGSGGNAIFTSGDTTVVRNGSVRGFSIGILVNGPGKGARIQDIAVSNCSFAGISSGERSLLERCHATGAGTFGVTVGAGSRLVDCVAHDNPGSGISALAGGVAISGCTATGNLGAGMSVGPGSNVVHSTATGNQSTGISLGSHGTMIGCTVRDNSSISPSQSAGIFVSDNCLVKDTVAAANTNTAASLSATGAGIIVTGANTQLINCVVTKNKGDGIRFSGGVEGDGGAAIGNLCNSNGNGGDGAGIHVVAGPSRVRIENNNVAGNDRGIDLDGSGNFVSRNTVGGNTTNWDVTGANVVLAVTAATSAFSGDSGGTAPGSTDPNANFTY